MVKYILVDIEGTTTSISFVHEVLFPYAKAHVRDYVQTHWEDPEMAEALEMVREDLRKEAGIEDAGADEVASALESWMAEDRKHTALKDIQGRMWRDGYTQGEFEGHVYPDVPIAFDAWKQAGLDLGVYSSGSVQAQKLLFGNSEGGDLTEYFSHYFDTRIGHKREVGSYKAIAEAIGLEAGEILFLSDVEAELDAAKAAGMQAIQLLRPGTIASERHATAADFSQILPPGTFDDSED